MKHIAAALKEIDTELESHYQSIAELERARSGIVKLGRLAEPEGDDPPPAAVRQTEDAPVAPRRGGRKPKKVKKAKRAKTATSASAGDVKDEIISALKAEQPQKPKMLAELLNVSVPTLRKHLNELEQSGIVVLTGATLNRQVALKGRKSSAKEGL